MNRSFDSTKIEDEALESSNPRAYYHDCCKYLDQSLEKSPDLANLEVRQAIKLLAEMLQADTSISDPEVAADLLLFGMVGQALYFLRGEEASPQFREELKDFLLTIKGVRSNAWLFHIAGRLARAGFAITFIRERGKESVKTPDFRARRDGNTLFVEASTREQTYWDINGVEGLIWNALHGDRRTGKQVKFESDEYDTRTDCARPLQLQPQCEPDRASCCEQARLECVGCFQ